MFRRLLKSERVYLRPVCLADAPLIVRWKRDPLIRRMALGPDARVSLDNQRRDIRRAIRSRDELYLIVVVRETHQPIGYVRINWEDQAHQNAWLRFALGQERGKGYATEALRCLLTHLFRRGLHRVDAEVCAFNPVSLRLLRRIGFKREGVKRQGHFDGRRYHDMIILGLLAADFTSLLPGR